MIEDVQHKEDCEGEVQGKGDGAEEVQDKDDSIFEEETVVPPRVFHSLRRKNVGKIAYEDMHQVFMTDTRVSRKATTDEYIQFNHSELATIVAPLLNATHEPLDFSEMVQNKRADALFSLFESVYAPEMDKKVDSLKGVEFKSPEVIIDALNLMLRSYVRGFSLHRQKAYKLHNGLTRCYLQCHTRQHKKKGSSDDEKSTTKCSWSMHIDYNDESARITSFDSFSRHCLNCLSCHSRMTSTELSLRCDIPPSHLDGVMAQFKQSSPLKSSIYCR